MVILLPFSTELVREGRSPSQISTKETRLGVHNIATLTCHILPADIWTFKSGHFEINREKQHSFLEVISARALGYGLGKVTITFGVF